MKAKPINNGINKIGGHGTHSHMHQNILKTCKQEKFSLKTLPEWKREGKMKDRNEEAAISVLCKSYQSQGKSFKSVILKHNFTSAELKKKEKFNPFSTHVFCLDKLSL